MTIFDIDERINDPWAGLRNTDAYKDYVLEEVQRLLDSGELIELTDKGYDNYLDGKEYTYSVFIFDGREFTYLYYRDKIVVCCEGVMGWEKAKWFECKDGKIYKKL